MPQQPVYLKNILLYVSTVYFNRCTVLEERLLDGAFGFKFCMLLPAMPVSVIIYIALPNFPEIPPTRS